MKQTLIFCIDDQYFPFVAEKPSTCMYSHNTTLRALQQKNIFQVQSHKNYIPRYLLMVFKKVVLVMLRQDNVKCTCL